MTRRGTLFELTSRLLPLLYAGRQSRSMCVFCRRVSQPRDRVLSVFALCVSSRFVFVGEEG